MSIEIYEVRAAWERVEEKAKALADIDRERIDVSDAVWEADGEVEAAWQEYLEIFGKYIEQNR